MFIFTHDIIEINMCVHIYVYVYAHTYIYMFCSFFFGRKRLRLSYAKYHPFSAPETRSEY